MGTRKRLIGSLIFMIIIIEIISYTGMKSLNPLLVYRQDNAGMKVAISILLGFLGLNILGFLFSTAVGERKCSACGLDLMQYALARGGPIKCRLCGKWYHQSCFKGAGGSVTAGCGACQSQGTGFDSFQGGNF